MVLAWVTFAAAWVVLYVGTVVTGSGPHAGDVDAPRNDLDPLQVSQLHADAVFLFVGLTIGLLLAVHAVGGTAEAKRAVAVLLGVELAQGTIGFVQYFTDLPEVLVGFHMLGAALVSAVVTWALLAVRSPTGGYLLGLLRPQVDPGLDRVLVDPGQLVVGQVGELQRVQVGVELLHRRGADDRRGHPRVAEHPLQRQLRQRLTPLVRDLVEAADPGHGLVGERLLRHRRPGRGRRASPPGRRRGSGR